MDIKTQLKQLSERVITLKEQIATEEATKNAFIMPFIQYLGYDVFNPIEVIPEFVADVGLKKGEKVDYAIAKNGTPIILIECKHWKQNLSQHDGQLLRYFHVSKAKFAILTNGIVYKFFTDLEETNKMDENPFFEFNMLDITDAQIEELRKFHKANFDVTNIIAAATEMKYTAKVKSILHSELKNPSETFTKYFVTQIYDGRITDKIMLQFSDLVKKSIQSAVSELITNRLLNAIDNENSQSDSPAKSESAIITTDEEMEGFHTIKAILRQRLEGNRITFKDSQSYFAITLDDNIRKTICRLYFNTAKKYIGITGADKKEVKNEINGVDDLYNFSEQLLAVVDGFEKVNTPKES